MAQMTIDNEDFFAEVKQLLEEGTCQFRVKGVSMMPLIRSDKDSVVVERMEGSPHLHDIVLFRFAPSDKWLLHRVVGRCLKQHEHCGTIIKEGSYIIQGDGCINAMEWCAGEDIAGRVVKIIRPSGREIDPYTPSRRRQFKLWYRWRGIRRYMLFAIRHMGWR